MKVVYGETVMNVDPSVSLEHIRISMSRIFPELKNAEAYLHGDEIRFRVRTSRDHRSPAIYSMGSSRAIGADRIDASTIRTRADYDFDPLYGPSTTALEEVERRYQSMLDKSLREKRERIESITIGNCFAERGGYTTFVGRRATVEFTLDDLEISLVKLIDQPDKNKEIAVHVMDATS